MNDIISGVIEKFLFQNIDNGFAVAVLATKQEVITARGYLPGVQAGQEVELAGAWVTHAKFGRQFEIQQCKSQLPKSIVGLKKYLGSGAIKGIGPTYAKRLVDHFGLQTLEIIEKYPHRLAEVSGLGVKRIEKITSTFKDQKEISNIMIFLQERDISTALSTKIYKKYKEESLAILRQNPYKLADDLWGVSFKTADIIAKKMNFKHDSPERISSGIIFALTQATQQGHLYLELEELKKQAIELLELNIETDLPVLKQSLHKLYDLNKIKLLTYNNLNYLTLSQFFASEFGVSEKIKKLVSYPSSYNFNIDQIYKDLSQDKSEKNIKSVSLNEKQQLGILTCLQNKITVITGGPGTGKTTLIKKLLSVLDDAKVNYKLAAPTGRAAKRIIESTGRQALTLHRLLDFNPAIGKFNHNEENALNLNFLIIDEASMIDIFLAHAILKAVPYNAHIVFIGDIDQLPSVGAGNFLGDIIDSQKIACVKLTEIFRQAQDSLIITNAHKINNGEFPTTVSTGPIQDFIFIKEENPETLLNYLKRILFIDLKKNNISIQDAIILAPMNKGAAGAHMLNHLMQEILNSKNKSTGVTVGSHLFCLADKVMQIRNNYNKHVYNGDIGVIINIDKTEKEITILFDDKREVVYEFDELNELVLAYAISIHKSQGSEYPAVIVPIFMQHFMLLQRRLIYTALTRAKKRCIFIGQPKALAMAISNSKTLERITFLNKFLSNPEAIKFL